MTNNHEAAGGELSAHNGAEPPQHDAAAWLDAGFDDADEVAAWLDAGCSDPAHAAALEQAGFTPEQAATRTDAGHGDADTVARKLARGDLSLAEARRIITSDFWND